MSLLEAEYAEYGLAPRVGLWEHLDISRREIVQLCGEKGKALFLYLLESSTIIPERKNIAIFSQQRLCDVALQLGWSPDTVSRYVAVFRAINLLSHYHDRRREVRLHIPLGVYVPLTNFAALDELIGKRKKLRQLSQKVKNRYIVCFGNPTQAHSDKVRIKIQKLQAILDGEHLEPLKRQRLLMMISDLITSLVETDNPSELGDPKHVPETPLSTMISNNGSKTTQQEDLNQQLGDLELPRLILPRSKPGQWGDLEQQPGSLENSISSTSANQSKQSGDLNQQPGDPNPHTLVQADTHLQPNNERQGDSYQQLGDLVPQQNALQPHHDGQLGDPTVQAVLKQGDSNQEGAVDVHPNAPYTYNVHFIINNISGNNVIRRQIALFLARILEKSEYENGYPTFSKYLKAFKNYSSDVIGRAFLVTMVLLHRQHWHVEKPGATFTDQCKMLSGQLPLAHYTLDEVEAWLQEWGHLSYPALITALAAPLSEPPSPKPAPLVSVPRQNPLASRGFGHDGTTGYPRQKRTYGMLYDGRPNSGLNRGIHMGSITPPPRYQSKT